MDQAITVRRVAGRRERNRFIDLPFRLYADQPLWVAPLIYEMKEKLDRSRHPFFNHSDAEFFLAYRDGRVTGRIAALVNNRHNEFHGERAGGFGFFECERDEATAAALIRTAAQWARDRDLDVLRGPFSFSTNEECATLSEGFDLPPTVMMPYNPPWYGDLLSACGLRPAKLLNGYILRDSGDYSRIKRVSERILQRRSEIAIRAIDIRNFESEIETALEIYNHAWEKNWGFVPMTEQEFRWQARKLKPVVEPDLALIATVDGRDAAFALSLPDLNQALAHVRGRLFPFGLFRFLKHRKNIDGIRVVTFGVRKEYRHLGLDGLMVYKTIEAAAANGYSWAELAWILEDNMPIRRVVEKMGARLYKKFTIWEAPVGELLA